LPELVPETQKAEISKGIEVEESQAPAEQPPAESSSVPAEIAE